MIRAWVRSAGLLLALTFASAAAQAPTDIRIALVIGNAAYPGGNALANPAHDARDMTDALKRLGFSVITVHDGGRAQMAEAIARVGDALKNRKGVGVLYYAGHGIQYEWRNYMVPVDAALRKPADIPVATVDVGSALGAFREAGNRLSIVILDACRDNPFDNQLATRGLAPVDVPPGTFMAFATAPGNVAEDGDATGTNGLYTRFLLQELRKPDARLNDVFTRVKVQVQQHSRGRQVPSESTNLEEDFSFDKGFATDDARRRAAQLEQIAAEKAAWDQIKDSRNVDDFFGFLQRYPSGVVSEVARFRLNQLQKPVLVVQPGRDGIQPLTIGTNRYALGDEYTLVVTDLLTRLTRREPQKVTLATDERVEINAGATVFNQMGGVLRDDSGEKDPPVLMVPADIALGKAWRSAFANSVAGYNLRTVVDFRTEALEDLDVQGTTVKAFRVRMTGSAGPVVLTGTLWIDPATMRLVRWDRMARAPGILLDASRIEVADYRAAPRR